MVAEPTEACILSWPFTRFPIFPIELRDTSYIIQKAYIIRVRCSRNAIANRTAYITYLTTGTLLAENG